MGPATGAPSHRVDENLVARLWDAQCPLRFPLRTTAGQEVGVVYRGRRRFDRGPDFPGSLVSIDETLLRGDVEVHVRSSDWRRHGHHLDPYYNAVILHIVLICDTAGPCLRQDGAAVPVLDLSAHLAEPLEGIVAAVDEAPRPVPCLPDSGASPELVACLRACGLERFGARVRRYESDLSCLSPDEVLYRGIADGLGFSHNREPFKRLTELLPLSRLLAYRSLRSDAGFDMDAPHPPAGGLSQRERRLPGLLPRREAHIKLPLPLGEGRGEGRPRDEGLPLETGPWPLAPDSRPLEALLLGAAGLLPSQRGLAPIDTYADALEETWCRDGGAWVGGSMRADEWQFFRVRPTNFPTRRVAALALVASRWPEDGMSLMLEELARATEPKKLPRTLESLLIGRPADGYWNLHGDFGQPLPRPAGLVGRVRATEIAVNLFLPFIAAMAAVTGEEELGRRAREVYQAYPKRGDNEITRYVATQITGIPRPPVARSACRQQGLLHIFRTWCDVKNCAECPLTHSLP